MCEDQFFTQPVLSRSFIHVFYGTPNFINVFIYTSTLPVFTLTDLNLIHNLATHFIEIDFNNIILSTPRSSNLYRPTKFYDEGLDAHAISSMCSFFLPSVDIKLKVKVTFVLERATKARGGVEVLLYSFLYLGASWGLMVNATPRPLYPRERPGTQCIGRWVGPRTVLDRCGKSRPHRDSIPGPSSP